MSGKPRLIYYSILSYQADNLLLLNDKFDLVTLKNPNFDNDFELGLADVILAPQGYFFGREKIDKCKKLKIIASNTISHKHIDFEYAESQGIKIITLKNDKEFLNTITSTAELTFGLIINLTRNIIPAVESVSNKYWNRRLNSNNQMLSRMSIGIVGLGRLGFKVGLLAKAFEMEVKYFDPYVDKKFPGIRKVSDLKELVSSVDVISVHAPLGKKTENMFNKEVFSSFRKESFFINTSNSKLVDQSELLRKLENSELQGAAIDVFENEFSDSFEANLDKHPLWNYAQKNNNLIITPHIGDSTKDTYKEIEECVLNKIIHFFDDQNINNNSYKNNFDFNNETIAFIPARGGSKSIPLKNLAKLNNIPLIQYPINASKKSEEIGEIVISTDNDKIKSYSLDQLVNVDIRPKYLGGDDIATVDVILDFLKRRMAVKKSLPEFLVLLEPTSPFVDYRDIDLCVTTLKNNSKFDSVQTHTEVSPNSHAYNQRYLNKDGSNFLYINERKSAFNKQKKPKLFIHGNIRVSRTSSLIKYRSIFGEYSLPIEISKIKSFDVDGPEDLIMAEALISSLSMPNI